MSVATAAAKTICMTTNNLVQSDHLPVYQLLCSTIAVEVNICACVHEYCIAGMLGKGKV